MIEEYHQKIETCSKDVKETNRAAYICLRGVKARIGKVGGGWATAFRSLTRSLTYGNR